MIKMESNGSVGKQNDQPKEFSTWLLELPPINLYNVDLVYLAFGYDMRWDLKEKYEQRMEIY